MVRAVCRTPAPGFVVFLTPEVWLCVGSSFATWVSYVGVTDSAHPLGIWVLLLGLPLGRWVRDSGPVLGSVLAGPALRQPAFQTLSSMVVGSSLVLLECRSLQSSLSV